MRREHLSVVVYQLKRVLVAGNDDSFNVWPVDRLQVGDGADDVIGFIALFFKNRDVKSG